MQNEQHMQPLRIPGGWMMEFNKLEDIKPEELSPKDKIWQFAYTSICIQIQIENEISR